MNQASESKENQSPQVQVSPVRLREVKATRDVFVDALNNHFDYFDAAYKQQVLADNSLASMYRAAIHPRRIILVARDAGRIIGYVIGSVPRGGSAQLFWLFVDPKYRGQNVGLMLLSRILRAMADKGAHAAALVTQDHAKYYARQGFKLIEKIPDGQNTKYVLSYNLRHR